MANGLAPGTNLDPQWAAANSSPYPAPTPTKRNIGSIAPGKTAEGGGGRSVASFLLLWGGYTLIWWGWCTIRSNNVGMADLVLPSRLDATIALLKANKSSGSSSTNSSGGGYTSASTTPGAPGNSKFVGNPAGGSRFGMPTAPGQKSLAQGG